MTIERKNKRLNSRLDKALVQRVAFGLLIMLIISFFVDWKLVIFLAAAVIFNGKLANFQLSKGLPTDFELSTFMTVMVTLGTHNLKLGIIVAIVSKLIASVMTANIMADHFFMILTYCIGAVVAFIVGGNPLIIGLIVVVMNCILMFLISSKILGLDLSSNVAYTGTNLIFNCVLFLTLANPVHLFLTL